MLELFGKKALEVDYLTIHSKNFYTKLLILLDMYLTGKNITYCNLYAMIYIKAYLQTTPI